MFTAAFTGYTCTRLNQHPCDVGAKISLLLDGQPLPQLAFKDESLARNARLDFQKIHGIGPVKCKYYMLRDETWFNVLYAVLSLRQVTSATITITLQLVSSYSRVLQV